MKLLSSTINPRQLDVVRSSLKTSKPSTETEGLENEITQKYQLTGPSSNLFEHCQGRPNLPSVVQQEKRSQMGREGGCLAIKQDNELKTQKSMFAKWRKSEVTHEEANAATNKWPRKSRASGDQRAQTPTTRIEATSPGICDKPCDQQP